MKRSLILVSLAIILLITHKGYSQAKRDTVTTLAAYMNYGLKGYLWGVVDRITVQDSVTIVKVDATTWKEKKSKVVYYSIVVNAPVDSLISKQFNVPVLDSLGKQNVISLRLNAEQKYVVEPVTDLRKAFKYLDQFLIKEPMTNAVSTSGIQDSINSKPKK